MIREYDTEELDSMDTLSEGQAADLKVDAGDFRVWQDRTGEDTPVQYELRVDGRWYDAEFTEHGDLTVAV